MQKPQTLTEKKLFGFEWFICYITLKVGENGSQSYTQILKILCSGDFVILESYLKPYLPHCEFVLVLPLQGVNEITGQIHWLPTSGKEILSITYNQISNLALSFSGVSALQVKVIRQTNRPLGAY